MYVCIYICSNAYIFVYLCVYSTNDTNIYKPECVVLPSEFGTEDPKPWRPAPGPSSCLRPDVSVAPAPDTDELENQGLSWSTHVKVCENIDDYDECNRI